MTSGGLAPFACHWASERSLSVVWPGGCSRENTQRVQSAHDALRSARLPALRNLHPAYASILIVFDPLRADPAELRSQLLDILATAPLQHQDEGPLHEVPTCYETGHAPDLESVAGLLGLTPAQVVELHAQAEYFVSFLGFAPGFPYLGGMPERLTIPRLAVPRKRVPAGSVAIGGTQTGIYPGATPGGWRIIGRTPLRIFSALRQPAALLTPGDRVRFRPISARELETLEGQAR